MSYLTLNKYWQVKKILKVALSLFLKKQRHIEMEVLVKVNAINVTSFLHFCQERYFTTQHVWLCILDG